MYVAWHKELGMDGLILLAVSKGRLRRQLIQIGQDPHNYTITELKVEQCGDSNSYSVGTSGCSI